MTKYEGEFTKIGSEPTKKKKSSRFKKIVASLGVVGVLAGGIGTKVAQNEIQEHGSLGEAAKHHYTEHKVNKEIEGKIINLTRNDYKFYNENKKQINSFIQAYHNIESKQNAEQFVRSMNDFYLLMTNALSQASHSEKKLAIHKWGNHTVDMLNKMSVDLSTRYQLTPTLLYKPF